MNNLRQMNSLINKKNMIEVFVKYVQIICILVIYIVQSI